jgi:putative transposase
MKKRYTEEQIIGFLGEADAGLPIKELCRRHGFSEASFYLWRTKFGGMSISDAKRLKELETENGRLERLLANAILENEVIREALQKSGDRTSPKRTGAASFLPRPERTAFPADCANQRECVPLPWATGSQCRTAWRDRPPGASAQALR